MCVLYFCVCVCACDCVCVCVCVCEISHFTVVQNVTRSIFNLTTLVSSL